MKIEKINIISEGFLLCKSKFYQSYDNLSSDVSFNFHAGINLLYGEIDSGIWAVSYLLSMYKYILKDFKLLQNSNIIVNDSPISLDELTDFSCYMDESYPMFSPSKSVKKQILDGLKKEKIVDSIYDIIKLFDLDEHRIERKLKHTGNEFFRAAAAIGYAHGKEIFCFPWMSKKRFDYYGNNIVCLINILSDLGKTIIVPLGQDTQTGDG